MVKKVSTGLFLLTLIVLAVFALRVQPVEDGASPDTSAGPPPPGRIISLAPSITEVLFALGLDEEIVGVTKYCDYPERAKTKPKVGDFISGDIERIIAMKPDLVVATRDGNSEQTITLLELLGIRVATYQPSTLEEVLDQILVLGKEVGRETQARSLVEECRNKASLVKERVSDAEVVPVLFVFSESPLILAGRGTFSDDMIKISGGRNISGDSRVPYPHFSMEEVLARAPEVIIDVSMGSDAAAEKAVEEYWSRWPELPAVKTHRVHVLDEDYLARPGHRLFEGLIMLAKSIHPERFAQESQP